MDKVSLGIRSLWIRSHGKVAVGKMTRSREMRADVLLFLFSFNENELVCFEEALKAFTTKVIFI